MTVTWHEYLNVAQGLGILAFAFEIFSFSMKNDNRQIILRTIASLFWMLHYHVLGKWVPALIVGLDFVRYGAAMYIRARPRLIYPALAAFSIVYLGISFYFQSSLIDLMPGITGVLSCYAIFALRDIPMRLGYLGVMSSWLVYDFCIHSVGGTINNAVMLTINGITIYRMLRDQRTHDEQ